MGGVLVLLLKLTNIVVIQFNVYAVTNLTQRNAFFESLHKYFFPSDSIVIAGNFNCYEYQSEKVRGNLSSAKYLSEFQSGFNLIDAWHCPHLVLGNEH